MITVVSLHKTNKSGPKAAVFEKEGHKHLESLLTETVPYLEGVLTPYWKESHLALKNPTPALWLLIAQYQTSHSWTQSQRNWQSSAIGSFN